MIKRHSAILILQIATTIIGCTANKLSDHTIEKNDQPNVLHYAENFSFEKTPQGITITIKEPFKGATNPKRYLLTDKTDSIMQDMYDAVIQVPISSMAATATSQIGFLDALQAEVFLTGFSTTDFISSPTFRERIATKQVVELGRDVNMDIEALITLSPDLLVVYSATSDVSHWDQIEHFGIPVIFDASFLETSPLAQAEWIKFFAALVGKTEEADSIFSAIEQNYNELLVSTKIYQNTPTVIAGTMYNGTWFMPGGKSWVATYINHAGGEYLWKDIQQTGSAPLSFEAVLRKELKC